MPGYDFRDKRPLEMEREARVSDPAEAGNDSPIGTTNGGYAKPEEGPFECQRCVHYAKINGTHGTCDHQDVVADATAGEIKLSEGGKAVVAARGCSNYFRPQAEA